MIYSVRRPVSKTWRKASLATEDSSLNQRSTSPNLPQALIVKSVGRFTVTILALMKSTLQTPIKPRTHRRVSVGHHMLQLWLSLELTWKAPFYPMIVIKLIKMLDNSKFKFQMTKIKTSLVIPGAQKLHRSTKNKNSQHLLLLLQSRL